MKKEIIAITFILQTSPLLPECGMLTDSLLLSLASYSIYE